MGAESADPRCFPYLAGDAAALLRFIAVVALFASSGRWLEMYSSMTFRWVASVCVGGAGWHHILEEGMYGSAGGSEKRAPLLQRMTLEVSALAPSVYATVTYAGASGLEVL